MTKVHDNNGKYTHIFTRRAFVIGGLQIAGLGLLAGRLAWIQMAQGQRYRTLSEKNRVNTKMLAPSRGLIKDRFGIDMAVNTQSFRLLAVPEQTENLEKSLRSAQALIGIDEKQLQNALERAKTSAQFIPLEIKDNLKWEDVAKIEVHLPDLPGLSVESGELRSYPFGESCAHITGYVSLPTQNDLSENPMLNLPGFKIGKTGIEKAYDENLRGEAGNAQLEVNVVGREIRELARAPSKTGDHIALSIDMTLQAYMHQRLSSERSACAVVMDAHTGAVYGLASYPSFDPNLFTHGLSAEVWEDMLANPGKPLTNKVTTGQYPPASTFKMMTALAGLESGHITESTSVYCPGFYEYGKDRFHCWKRAGHGNVDLTEALAESCDTFFYKLATEIGIDKIAETARRFSLGSKLGFDLGGEKPGLIPDKQWKRGYFGKAWKPGETIVASIGQGYIQATPLQLAVMTARLVNGGHKVKPWITGYMGEQAVFKNQWPDMDIDPDHLVLVKRGMDKVVNSPKGTAHGSRIEKDVWAMGGKTGTAQVRRITQQQRQSGARNEDMNWKYRHHALFVGYAPVTDPRYVCCIVVEHGVGGSLSAAPIARDILTEVQRRGLAETSFKPKGVL